MTQLTGLTHEITTIEQFAALVTKENLPYIMKDFQSVLETFLAIDEVCKQASDLQGIEHEKLVMDTFNWIDDGKHELSEVTIQAQDDPSTKFVFKEVRKESE